MKLSEIRTAHFWLTALGIAAVLGMLVCIGLALAGHLHLYTMGGFALAIAILHPAAVVNAAAYIPPGLLARLETKDVQSLIARGIASLLEKAGVKIDSLSSILAAEAQASLVTAVGMPPATAPTTVAVTETVAVTK